jgi:hypothetical protein
MRMYNYSGKYFFVLNSGIPLQLLESKTMRCISTQYKKLANFYYFSLLQEQEILKMIEKARNIFLI